MFAQLEASILRYFFHVQNGRLYKDEIGQDFSSVEDVRSCAAVIARELARDGRQNMGIAVLVIDENENEVARVPISRNARYRPLK